MLKREAEQSVFSCGRQSDLQTNAEGGCMWSSMRQSCLFPGPHAMQWHRMGGAGQLLAGCTVSAFRQALRMSDKPAGRLLQLAAASAQRRLRAVDPARDMRPKHLRASNDVS